MLENNYQEISELKKDLLEAFRLRIENSELISNISLEVLASDVKSDIELIYSVVNDIDGLILYWFDEQISEIFIGLVEEFSDDTNASTKEKITETLMSILETFANKRQLIHNVYQRALRDVKFSFLLLNFLQNMCDRILAISGDKKQDMPIPMLLRSARVKGLIGVLIKIIPVWLKDNSEDLSVTYREIDQSLHTASEWAESLRVI